MNLFYWPTAQGFFISMFVFLSFLPSFTSVASQWRTEVVGVWGVQNPLPEILKALQNRAKINLVVKTVKNC